MGLSHDADAYLREQKKNVAKLLLEAWIMSVEKSIWGTKAESFERWTMDFNIARTFTGYSKKSSVDLLLEAIKSAFTQCYECRTASQVRCAISEFHEPLK